jgi:hypothetical protein
MITQEKLHEVFEYRDNGNLVWKVRLSWRVQVGTIAGTVENNGYIRVTINGKPYRMHQLVFLYHNGYLTKGKEIDHIDGDRTNNRIENLREVTKAQNSFNRKYVDNTSGFKGISWCNRRRKWVVQIMVDGRNKNLGRYDTIKEAIAVVIAGRNELHGEFARHN